MISDVVRIGAVEFKDLVHIRTLLEIDAASNNSVDDIRDIRNQAIMRSLDCEFKVFILDEAHALSRGAWEAMLKILEEPPKGVIFVFCTTEPKKIPLTILSRAQRFDFKRVSYNGILNRLIYILEKEKEQGRNLTYERPAIEFIAKLADGGMRAGITMLDKCLGLSENLTYDGVCSALGVLPYENMFNLVSAILSKETGNVMQLIEKTYLDGCDLKQFMADYAVFLLDLVNYQLNKNYDMIKIPESYSEQMNGVFSKIIDTPTKLRDLLYDTTQLANIIKYEDKPKFTVMTGLMKQSEA